MLYYFYSYCFVNKQVYIMHSYNTWYAIEKKRLTFIKHEWQKTPSLTNVCLRCLRLVNLMNFDNMLAWTLLLLSVKWFICLSKVNNHMTVAIRVRFKFKKMILNRINTNQSQRYVYSCSIGSRRWHHRCISTRVVYIISIRNASLK